MPSVEEILSVALQYHRGARLAEAETGYRHILDLQPNHADALHLLGMIGAEHRALAPAADLILRALAIEPGRGDFYAALGNVYQAQGKYLEAIEAYKHAMHGLWFSRVPVPNTEILAHAGTRSRAEPGAGVDRYKSQYFQDLVLDKWIFGGLEGGVFVDIGAHDGVTYSNTYFFETDRNWTGVCIEPNPDVFAKLNAGRKSRNLNCAVGQRRGTLDFLKVTGYSEMLSGLIDNYDTGHIRRIETELEKFGGSKEIIRVDVRNFADIAAQCGLDELIYLSIDTEGGEAEILETIDFKRHFVHAATIECNSQALKDRLVALMNANGFDLAQVLICDLLFLNRASPYRLPNSQHKRT